MIKAFKYRNIHQFGSTKEFFQFFVDDPNVLNITSVNWQEGITNIVCILQLKWTWIGLNTYVYSSNSSNHSIAHNDSVWMYLGILFYVLGITLSTSHCLGFLAMIEAHHLGSNMLNNKLGETHLAIPNSTTRKYYYNIHK